MHDLPERPLTPREWRGMTCPECGAEIAVDEKYIVWRNETLCMDCARESVIAELDHSGFRKRLYELAELFRFDVGDADACPDDYE